VENQSDYRVGSPFAQETAVPLAAQDAPSIVIPDNGTSTANGTLRKGLAEVQEWQVLADGPETLGQGVWAETATSAVYAAIILICFAAICWAVFPGGGVAVAGLGSLVSLLGLSSRHGRLATVALILHGSLFFACYLRAI
jgi:hypothetical protein